MQPSLTSRDLQAATTPQALARGRGLAASVEDLGWDEYSIWGGLPSEGIDAGNLMIHHSDLPLCGECPCPDKGASGLCAHMAAVGWAFLGDDQELADRLAALSHAELVALVTNLADNIPRARDAVWSRLFS